MSAPLTAGELREALAAAGLPGAEVQPRHNTLHVSFGRGDAYHVLGLVNPDEWPNDGIAWERIYAGRYAEATQRQHDAAARAMALPTAAEVRALQEAARLAREALEDAIARLPDCALGRSEEALAALRKVLPT